MGREDFIKCSDNADVWGPFLKDPKFVVLWHGGKGVGDVGAAHLFGGAGPSGQAVQACKVGLAGRFAAFADAVGDLLYDGT